MCGFSHQNLAHCDFWQPSLLHDGCQASVLQCATYLTLLQTYIIYIKADNKIHAAASNICLVVSFDTKMASCFKCVTLHVL